MGRTLEDMISSESPEVVQRAKALAEEQLVRLSVTKLLSISGLVMFLKLLPMFSIVCCRSKGQWRAKTVG